MYIYIYTYIIYTVLTLSTNTLHDTIFAHIVIIQRLTSSLRQCLHIILTLFMVHSFSFVQNMFSHTQIASILCKQEPPLHLCFYTKIDFGYHFASVLCKKEPPLHPPLHGVFRAKYLKFASCIRFVKIGTTSAPSSAPSSARPKSTKKPNRLRMPGPFQYIYIFVT